MISEAILSLIGGGVMRLLPELIGLWNRKTDYAHEKAMAELQAKLQAGRSADDRALVWEQSMADTRLAIENNNAAEVLALLDAQKSALAGQMQKIGVWWVDAMNTLVRPSTTYYFLFFHFLAKLCLLVVAFQSGPDRWKNMLAIYTEADASILLGILSFWFVGRVFDKKS